MIATGICGSDVHGLAGGTGRREIGQVMGNETVGRVLEVGPGADVRLIGRLVTVKRVMSCGECASFLAGAEQICSHRWVLGVRPDVDAAFANEFSVPARSLVPLTEGIVEWHGALIEPLAVEYHAGHRGSPTQGDRVLVIGGEPIGQPAAIACERFGVASVVVSGPYERRREMVEKLGFTDVAPDALTERPSVLMGEGATLVIDAVGSEATLRCSETLNPIGP